MIMNHIRHQVGVFLLLVMIVAGIFTQVTYSRFFNPSSIAAATSIESVDSADRQKISDAES